MIFIVTLEFWDLITLIHFSQSESVLCFTLSWFLNRVWAIFRHVIQNLSYLLEKSWLLSSKEEEALVTDLRLSFEVNESQRCMP